MACMQACHLSARPALFDPSPANARALKRTHRFTHRPRKLSCTRVYGKMQDAGRTYIDCSCIPRSVSYTHLTLPTICSV
eukprot:513539-Alexandrium_andersonii.AAC.1